MDLVHFLALDVFAVMAEPREQPPAICIGQLSNAINTMLDDVNILQRVLGSTKDPLFAELRDFIPELLQISADGISRIVTASIRNNTIPIPRRQRVPGHGSGRVDTGVFYAVCRLLTAPTVASFQQPMIDF